uniref:Hypotheticial protein n=1 Tax=Schistosoma japonicum TaxID=6182 RepID=C1LFA5_SCHJA|nr:hypotheticial protein [Schistosoma japonicum]
MYWRALSICAYIHLLLLQLAAAEYNEINGLRIQYNGDGLYNPNSSVHIVPFRKDAFTQTESIANNYIYNRLLTGTCITIFSLIIIT